MELLCISFAFWPYEEITETLKGSADQEILRTSGRSHRDGQCFQDRKGASVGFMWREDANRLAFVQPLRSGWGASLIGRDPRQVAD